MSRVITEHQDGSQLNNALEVTAVGEPGAGGAHWRYDIIGHGEHVPNFGPRPFGVNLRFQNGPVSKTEDLNGITNEALLAVVIDRLKGFQAGPFPCHENEQAWTHCAAALAFLKTRTRDRIERSVEGKNQA